MYKKVQWIGMIAGVALPLFSAYSQESTPAVTLPATNVLAAPASLPPSAAEVVKLSQSGVGDEVVLAYVKNAQSSYNLSAKDVLALKDSGISSPVLTAMLNHDTALQKQAVPVASPQNQQGQYTYDQKAYVAGNQPPVQPQPTTVAPPPANQAPQVAQPAPVQPQQPVMVQTEPPPAQVEVIPAAPGPDYYWTPGYWSWRGGAYVWIGGSYIIRPRPSAVYVGGYWGHHGRGYVWVGGHWR
ncbi:YXWGXW repeat-containing protein [Pedosphaera parvula]|uniref:Uncharacterized protein n=1 Tax=Pedosphaera parvula (strain Ellin514) TaxID=320771 RepID=B9XBQ3_PEDPL|nr:YXWGXW repeat-containing protein [Pedosphaera parvula]EEF62938.1 hypothetical protein Cflav_PD5573 [Pedosphaera parvula Ellin514]